MVRAKTLRWLLVILLLVLSPLVAFALWAGKPSPYARRPNQGTFQHWMQHYRFKLVYLIARKGSVPEASCKCQPGYRYEEKPMFVLNNVYEHCQQKRRLPSGIVAQSGKPCGFAGRLAADETEGTLMDWDDTSTPVPAATAAPPPGLSRRPRVPKTFAPILS